MEYPRDGHIVSFLEKSVGAIFSVESFTPRSS